MEMGRARTASNVPDKRVSFAEVTLNAGYHPSPVSWSPLRRRWAGIACVVSQAIWRCVFFPGSCSRGPLATFVGSFSTLALGN